MAFTLYRAWQSPLSVENGRWVSLGVGIMVLEFILVHASAMLPALAAPTATSGRKTLLGISALYVVFGVAISLAFRSGLLFGAFLAIMIPRWIEVLTDPIKAREQTRQRSAISAVLYLGVAALSVFVRFPRAGLTPEILNQVYPNRGDGLWETQPQQALVAGMVYFGLLGLAELVVAFRRDQSAASPVIPEPARPTFGGPLC